MKKFLAFLFTFTYFSALAQWFPYFLPYQGISNSLDFWENNGVSTGHTFFPFNEQLYYTTNFGNNWNISTYPSEIRALTSVQFVNPFIVYAGGAENLLINTIKKMERNFFALPFYLKFPLQMKGINDNSSEYKATFIKSSNGGISWSKIGQFDINTGYINDIQFFNETTGFVIIDSGSIGNSRLLKTENGGLNWYTINLEPLLRLSRMDFLNPNTGFVCGDKSDTNLLSGMYGVIFRTTNGGITWAKEVFQYTASMVDIEFNNSNTGFLLGNGNLNGNLSESCMKVFKTTNGGINWDSTNTFSFVIPTAIKSIKGTEITFAIGYYYDYNLMTGKIATIKTTNSGNSWNINFLNDDVYVMGLSLINENIFFISGGGGNQQAVIYKSTNGGTKIKNFTNIIPEHSELFQNYPNPFNLYTRIKFTITSFTQVYLTIFNILGQKLDILINEKLTPGLYEVEWNATRFPSGIYYYRLKAGNYNKTNKMLLLK